MRKKKSSGHGSAKRQVSAGKSRKRSWEPGRRGQGHGKGYGPIAGSGSSGPETRHAPERPPAAALQPSVNSEASPSLPSPERLAQVLW